jgi:hypothetical protein
MNETVESKVGAAHKIGGKTLYHFECRDQAGNLKWEAEAWNLVVDEGLNDWLDKYFKGSSYTAAWYVGLKNVGTVAAADTAASHGGWTEFTSYNGVRKTLALGAVSAKSVSSSSAAVFSITGSGTVVGAFLAGTNTGTGSVLYGAVDFGASRVVTSGDIINVNTTLAGTAV